MGYSKLLAIFYTLLFLIFHSPASANAPSGIGNYVWVDEDGDGDQDPGESGLANVLVMLSDSLGNTLDSTYTDADGGYFFPNLPPANYYIGIDETSLPNGMAQTPTSYPGADFGNQPQAGNGYLVHLDGYDNMTADFGYTMGNPNDNSGNGAIGNLVWSDYNANGTHDPGEAGIGNSIVTILYDADSNGFVDSPYSGAIDQNGNTGASTTTNPEGRYYFHGLPPGIYQIVVSDGPGSTLDGYAQTGDPDDPGTIATNPDGQTTIPIILAPGDFITTANFGYQAPVSGSISSTIWLDIDTDGIQDPNEKGISNVAVSLIVDQNSNGTWNPGEPIIATDLTNEGGDFSFTGLPLNNGGTTNFIIFVNDSKNALDKLKPTYDSNGIATPNTTTVTLSITSPNDNKNNFGYTPEGHLSGTNLIASTVFLDTNMDGIPSQGEGLKGIVIYLLDDNIDTIATTTTGQNGNYYFGNLPDGTYSIQVDQSTLPAGLSNNSDPDDDGIPNNGDEDSFATIALTSAEANTDQNFGYIPITTGSIGNLVWEDSNANGQVDPGENGIEGITLSAYLDANNSGTLDPGEALIATDVTDVNGAYLFEQLPITETSSYLIIIDDINDLLNNYWHSTGAAQTNNHSQALPYCIKLGTGNSSNFTADFGFYYRLAALGNYTWLDENQDCVQDASEPGLSNIPVLLHIKYPSGDSIQVQTISDNTGHYQFANLMADEDFNSNSSPVYILSTKNPYGYVSSNFDINPNDFNDADNNFGVTAYPEKGNTNLAQNPDPLAEPVPASYDFGFLYLTIPTSIGNLVWSDEDGDGDQDAGEPGLANVLIILNDSLGTAIDSTFSDSNGGYLFDNLSPGNYFVNIDETSLPDGMQQSPAYLPGVDLGNQTHSDNGYPVTLLSRQEDLTADFGYTWGDPNGNTGQGAIGNRVWADSNNNGHQDPGEAGIGGVNVRLYYDSDENGEIVPGIDSLYPVAIDAYGNAGGETTTAADGSYIFHQLHPGIYKVLVIAEIGTVLDGFTQTGDPDQFGILATAPDGHTTNPLILPPGDVFLNVDFGYQPPASGTIGQNIWFDADANGLNNGEAGIPGITVSLILDENGNGIRDMGELTIGSTTTDPMGNYIFSGLPLDDNGGDNDADFIVFVNDSENVLDGLSPTYDTDGIGPENTSTASLSNGAATDLSQSFGYTTTKHLPGKGMIGNCVFLDVNKDNKNSPGEGLEGVPVTLLDSLGDTVASTQTNENGNYYFGNLPEGSYIIQVDMTSMPEGLSNSIDPDGGNDGQSTIILAEGEVQLDQVFGFYPATSVVGTIGSFIWEDLNGNGLANSTELPYGLEGVTVDLYWDIDGNGMLGPGEPKYGTATSDNSGTYQFDGLPVLNGIDYLVVLTDRNAVLNGSWHSTGTPNNNNNSQTTPYYIQLDETANVNETADFGYYNKLATLGNYTWIEDLPENGTQDQGEEPLSGVEVFLRIKYPDGNDILLRDTSKADGHYSFYNLLADEDFNLSSATYLFTLNAIAPQGYKAMSLTTYGSDQYIDSDDHTATTAFPLQGRYNSTLSNMTGTEASYDFGFFEVVLPIDLTIFEGKEENCNIMLHWQTASEQNTAFFQVERSTDRVNFETIGYLTAAGNSTEPKDYYYTDEFIGKENYYRLKEIDLSGEARVVGEIIAINSDCFLDMETGIAGLYPNPTLGNIDIKFYSPADTKVEWLVTDVLGRILMDGNVDIKAGASLIKLDLKGLSPAPYFLQFKGEDWYTEPQKLIKINP